MIATNLIATLLMALGVATGNVSSNTYKGGNAFKNEEKIEKPKQKINETITNTLSYTLAQEIYINNIVNDQQHVMKYYLNDGAGTIDTTYSTQYYNIYNTTYTYPIQITESATFYYLISIYKFTPYFNFIYENITMTQNVNAYYNPGYQNNIDIYSDNYITNYNIDQYIGINLNSSTPTRLNEFYTSSSQQAINRQTTQKLHSTGNVSNQLIENSYTINNIQKNETINVVMTCTVQIYNQNGIGIQTPQNVILTGLADIPAMNYEVIDIPNIMFTILTLPFSWYSTAFNLTIFPNTPYSLNFGNLVLTIVAAMILLYLIRKIIK